MRRADQGRPVAAVPFLEPPPGAQAASPWARARGPVQRPPRSRRAKPQSVCLPRGRPPTGGRSRSYGAPGACRQWGGARKGRYAAVWQAPSARNQRALASARWEPAESDTARETVVRPAGAGRVGLPRVPSCALIARVQPPVASSPASRWMAPEHALAASPARHGQQLAREPDGACRVSASVSARMMQPRRACVSASARMMRAR